MADGSKRVGLIGYPLGHSLSPAFQQAALDARGIAARYELWPTPPEGVPGLVAGLRRPDAFGCNVTIPHKEIVVGLVDESTPAVARLGAANTIVRLADGRLRADNTDLHGFGRTLAGTVEVIEVDRPTLFTTLTTYDNGIRVWWTQHMIPAGSGTDEVDDVEYELPSGVLSLLGPLVRRRLERAMRESNGAYAEQVMRRVHEGSAADGMPASNP